MPEVVCWLVGLGWAGLGWVGWVGGVVGWAGWLGELVGLVGRLVGWVGWVGWLVGWFDWVGWLVGWWVRWLFLYVVLCVLLVVGCPCLHVCAYMLDANSS